MLCSPPDQLGPDPKEVPIYWDPVIVLLDNSSTHHGGLCRNFWTRTRVSIGSIFLPMLWNSTLTKGFGLWLSANWPIVARTIWTN